MAHDARLDGAQMVPAVATTAKAAAVGRLVGTLDTVKVLVGYTGLSGPPLADNPKTSALTVLLAGTSGCKDKGKQSADDA